MSVLPKYVIVHWCKSSWQQLTDFISTKRLQFVLSHSKANFSLFKIQYNRSFAIKSNRTKTLSMLCLSLFQKLKSMQVEEGFKLIWEGILKMGECYDNALISLNTNMGGISLLLHSVCNLIVPQKLHGMCCTRNFNTYIPFRRGIKDKDTQVTALGIWNWRTKQ